MAARRSGSASSDPPVISVRFDAAAGTLAVEPQTLDLGNFAQTVTWLFTGIPNDLVPSVRFETEAPEGRFGPFLSLRCDPFRVFGQGRTGLGGDFPYVVEILSGADGSPVAELAGLRLSALATAPDTNPIVEVRLDLQNRIEVEPGQVEIFRGQSVSWRFVDVDPARYVPYLRFTKAPANVVNPCFGPFQCLTVTADGILGAGSNGIAGSYSYEIGLRELNTGKRAHWILVDPAIASRGDPPGG